MKLATALQKVGYGIVLVTIFLVPIFFLPITSEFYEFNKNSLLIFSSLSLLVLWAVTSVVDRQVRIIRSPLSLPLLVLVVVWIASAVLRSPNRVEAFLNPGQAGTWLALGIFYLTSLNFVRTKKEVDGVVYALLGSLSVLAIVTLAWSSNVITKIIPSLPGYLSSELWNPSGSLLTAALGLASGVPLVIWLLVKQKSRQLISALLAFSLLAISVGAGAAVYRLANPLTAAGRAAFLPVSTGWGIALEALKASPVIGSGPATFLADFTRFRPITFNLTPNWALRFVTSSNYYLELLATLGAAGLAAYLFLISRTYKLLIKTAKLPHNTTAMAAGLAAAACFLLQLFFPINLVLLVLTLVYLIILIASLKQLGTSIVHEANIDIVATGSTSNSPLLPWTILVLSMGFGAATAYLGGRAYWAEVLYQKALVAAAQNDGQKTYNTLIAAIGTNPYLDTYRVTYSRTNLLLANSLATKSNLKDQDRTVISQLVQQAIREAKNAVALNPLKVTSVENLAVVYRNLLSFAQGADAWTVASYRQAIALDPVNPNLRIALGGVFYSQKSWDEAIRFFQSAIDLKPDLANAHYNLSAAYREKGDLAQAVTALQNAAQLVDKSTSDYDKVVKELADLQAKAGPAAAKPEAQNANPSELTTPEPLPTPAVKPPLQLDQSLSPEAPATPSSQP